MPSWSEPRCCWSRAGPAQWEGSGPSAHRQEAVSEPFVPNKTKPLPGAATSELAEAFQADKVGANTLWGAW